MLYREPGKNLIYRYYYIDNKVERFIDNVGR